MAENASYFTGHALKETLLKARGFDAKTGARSGGIKQPVQTSIPVGTVLLRTYQDPAYLFGGWWFTPYEMSQIIAYFAVDSNSFSKGRPSGKGVLQGTLAVRHEWGNNSPAHMGTIAAVRTTKPLVAMVGESDSAADSTQTKNLKPIQISDRSGNRRNVRQVFLPSAFNYKTSFVILERDLPSDTDLFRLVNDYNKGPAPFES
jgi:hypothetical protein